MAKKRIYQIAKEFSVSSEALLKILRGMKIEAKSHMSSIDESLVDEVRKKFEAEKKTVAREVERQQELHEAKKIEPPKAPVKKPAPRPAASPPPKGGSARSAGSPPPKTGRRSGQRGRRARVVDEKTVRASIKKTLADLEIGKKRRRRRKHTHSGAETEEAGDTRKIQITELATVAELASVLEVNPSELIAKCMEFGLMVTMNRRLDPDTIETIADEYDLEVEFLSEYGSDEPEGDEATGSRGEPRHPVVTIMGHVDHGKTSLLDFVRKSNVIAGEMGGITQHIGAYEVDLPEGRITFLDTPGHAAFSAMRARGAQVTDLVILVVAADDQVMPQTVEAIDHAKAAGVPIIVAINKVDRPEADPMRIKQQLAEQGVQVEEWGGKVVAVEISAKTGQNIDKLLEYVLLEAELLELHADATRRARGTVIESRLEPGRGIVISCLVQDGTLKKGDPFVAGSFFGKVRALFDERGKIRKDAGPSSTVELLGSTGVPQAGDSFTVFPDERSAKEVASKRQQQLREQTLRYQKRMSLDELFAQIQSGGTQTLSLVIKGDVDGSVEAVTEALNQLSTDEVKVDVIHKSVGTVTESDILLAAASNAVVIGFHTKAESKAARLAEKEGVSIRFYSIIYEAVDEVRRAMEGLLKPESRENVIGKVEVREIFTIGRTAVIAGSYVLSGTIKRSSKIRVLRDDLTIFEGKLETLRRFKDDVREVQAGYECGIKLDGFNDIKESDILEVFEIEEVARTL